MEFLIKNLTPIKRYLEKLGLGEEVSFNSDDLKTTGQVINAISCKEEALKKLIKGTIKLRVEHYLPSDGLCYSSFMKEFFRNRKSVELGTSYRFPSLESTFSIRLFLTISFLVYLPLLYILFISFTHPFSPSLVLLMGGGSLSGGIALAFLIYFGIYNLFPYSIRKEHFEGVSSVDEFYEEMYMLNRQFYEKDDYAELNILLHSISVNNH